MAETPSRLTAQERRPNQAQRAVAASNREEVSQGGHLPVLDGLRGLAILLVMVHHFAGGIEHGGAGIDLWIGRITGMGWCGVDLFFVLSGFLITGILCDTRGLPGYLRNFYARRVLRIFPLYYGLLLVLFVLLPVALRGAMPGLEKVSKNQGWLWLYLSNFATVFGNDELFRGGLVQTGHFWSLAVEEQFYLLWPLLVLTMRRRSLVRLCGSLIMVVLALRILLVSSGFPRIYYFTPCRLDGLMAGALLSLLLRGEENEVAGVSGSWDRRIQQLAPLGKRVFLICGAGLGGIWLKWGLDSEHWSMTTIGFTLLAGFFGAALLLLLAVPKASVTGRIFNSPILRFLGKYSYGLYVFHFALEPSFRTLFGVNLLVNRVFHHYWPARFTFMTLAMTASMAIAWVCWHLYEKQFLKLKRFFQCRAELKPQIVTTNALAATPLATTQRPIVLGAA